MALGYNRPDDIPITLSTVMQNIIDDKTLDVSQGIIHHSEGVDLLPSNIEMSGFEVIRRYFYALIQVTYIHNSNTSLYTCIHISSSYVTVFLIQLLCLDIFRFLRDFRSRLDMC